MFANTPGRQRPAPTNIFMEYKYLQNPISKRWIVLAPRRAKRPDEAKKMPEVCPFCPGREGDEEELYRAGGNPGNTNWDVRVLANKYPFSPRHEVIILSPDHHKGFGELPVEQAETIMQVYRQRYLTHEHSGQVYIFNNHGIEGGESLPHPHSQLVVVPPQVTIAAWPVGKIEPMYQETSSFILFCPAVSQWPDEVWIVPKRRYKKFGEASNDALKDLAFVLTRLIDILDLRHGHEFPYNFFIFPGHDWYLRLVPRVKSLGGFEIGTGIYVNTQEPKETIAFIKEHFENPDREKIRHFHRAEYRKRV